MSRLKDRALPPTPNSNFEVRTISDRLGDVVRDLILAGEIAPGMAIRQDALAAQLRVSKVPLREALARLEQDGLVSSAANRGYFVRPLVAEEAEEVFALRLKIEPDAAAKACILATHDEQAYAQNMLENLNRETANHGPGASALNRAFHLSLVSPGGAKVTAELVMRLHVLADRYVRKHLEPHNRSARAAKEHRDILDHWLAKHGDKVDLLITQHLQQTLSDLRAQL